ncbi:MAG TPA: CHAT domain-containing tetratricopeptide repeat protein [Puia sp.]|nr:CHAT domain-containing tetratricopeptide repeat protein [Puia sp.]
MTLLAFLALVSLNFGNPGTPLSRILTLYHKADDLFRLPNSTPANDSTALAGFEQVIAELQKYPDFSDKDTLLFQSWLKKGVLLDVKYNYTGAKEAYCRALNFHKQNDSLGFVAYIYAGTSYYNLNNFDSANYCLLKAESMADRFRDPDDEVRLYNTLGALYHANGNYQQGKNYFNRALEIIKGKKPFDTTYAVTIETNIATSFSQLGLYQESLSIYNKILAYRIFTDHTYLNMGTAYAALNKYREAMACFRKVNETKVPGVFNEMGYMQFQLHKPDSAAWFLDRLQAPGNAGKLNDLDLGINDLYRADLLAGQQQYRTALTSLQRAIIIFSRNFNNEDIFSNPANFTGTFASYRLFDALFKKAALFERLFRTQPKEEYLRGSYEAYKAALSLLRYIEKSYDTDDAKIFLKKNNGEVYQGALSVCLELYRLHPEDNYLEQAFLISEKNKASIIIANLKERTSNKIPGIESTLLQRERNIKYNIARLNVKSEETPDRGEVEKIAGEKAGYEIELSRLQKELEQNGNYYKLKYDDSSPGLKELQQHLNDQQALISFYATKETLHIFIVTQSSFAYTRVDSLSTLQKEVGDWLQLLKTTENGRKFKGETLGSRLYQQLIKPIQALIPGKEEWIIIPDGFLYFLPFESLPANKEGTTLLETTTISYQFSARLIASPATPAIAENPISVLAFAPFAGKGTSPAQSGSAGFSQLSASRAEVTGLQGKVYIDSLATKTQFLKEINKYPIVHLATHAVSAVDNASASFIAFYPEKGSQMEDCLYLEELYGLNMNATKLVIISACETGQGELVSNEGVISLARAFAYAGCESTINSLWKADDKATSFIIGQFHIYLQKGYTKSKALRQAKLDYLKSDAINKSPAYWSHLILTGNIEPLYASGIKAPGKWSIFILLLAILSGFFIGIRKRIHKKLE